ncbi:MAG TPA: ester cyclase [Caulobacteraceae bacterium]
MDSPADLLQLWHDFTDLWNGDYSLARIVAPDFTLHAHLIGGLSSDSVRGPEGLANWIRQARAPFSEVRFVTEVGPLVSDDYVSGRWVATGAYQGGFPGAKAKAGARVAFAGNDILRTEQGLIVDYWTCADTLALLTQLEAL